MNLYNLKHLNEKISFKEAVIQGLGRDRGLYFPEDIPFLEDLPSLLKESFLPRSAKILKTLIGDELSFETLMECVHHAFNFPIVLKAIEENIFALELFHGPTLAFKDFGARLMAQILKIFTRKPLNIITATSGDTGAAVAHAFYQIPHIQVFILYPNKRISLLQEKLFCTLGSNIHTLAIEGDFDACQTLVKQSFSDPTLKLALNSANSINISRILAQMLYYFEAVAQLPSYKKIMCSVPSGNFGNLTAGLFSKAMGLPIDFFLAATNSNDTIPRYLSTKKWAPYPTQPTLSNAMDVSEPNNWPRVEALFKARQWNQEAILSAQAVNEKQTIEGMRSLLKIGYGADPHSAVAYYALKKHLPESETGIFLCTAHPAKFKDSVDNILKTDLALPKALSEVSEKKILSHTLANDYELFRSFLLNHAIQ